MSIASLKTKIEYLAKAVNILMEANKQHGGVIHKTAVLKAQEDLFFVQQGYDDLEYFLKPPEPEMSKRFLGAFVGGLISGTLFGLFNTAKIAALQSSLNDMEKARVNMVHLTDRIANAATVNAQHITALEQMTQEIAQEVSTTHLCIYYSITITYS